MILASKLGRYVKKQFIILEDPQTLDLNTLDNYITNLKIKKFLPFFLVFLLISTFLTRLTLFFVVYIYREMLITEGKNNILKCRFLIVNR